MDCVHVRATLFNLVKTKYEKCRNNSNNTCTYTHLKYKHTAINHKTLTFALRFNYGTCVVLTFESVDEPYGLTIKNLMEHTMLAVLLH